MGRAVAEFEANCWGTPRLNARLALLAAVISAARSLLSMKASANSKSVHSPAKCDRVHVGSEHVKSEHVGSEHVGRRRMWRISKCRRVLGGHSPGTSAVAPRSSSAYAVSIELILLALYADASSSTARTYLQRTACRERTAQRGLQEPSFNALVESA